MKNVIRGRTAAALGIGLLAAMPAGAAESSAWLQRQFSTDHGTYSMPALERHSDTIVRLAGSRSSHTVAAAWIERHLAGKASHDVVSGGVAGPSGPELVPAQVPIDAEAWLERQFSTSHTLQAR